MKGLSLGVSTPGIDRKTARPERAAESASLHIEHRAKILELLPAAFTRRIFDFWIYLGLKPQAESFHRFGIVRQAVLASGARLHPKNSTNPANLRGIGRRWRPA